MSFTMRAAQSEARRSRANLVGRVAVGHHAVSAHHNGVHLRGAQAWFRAREATPAPCLHMLNEQDGGSGGRCSFCPKGLNATDASTTRCRRRQHTRHAPGRRRAGRRWPSRTRAWRGCARAAAQTPSAARLRDSHRHTHTPRCARACSSPVAAQHASVAPLYALVPSGSPTASSVLDWHALARHPGPWPTRPMPDSSFWHVPWL